jgi:hypothetical protein
MYATVSLKIGIKFYFLKLCDGPCVSVFYTVMLRQIQFFSSENSQFFGRPPGDTMLISALLENAQRFALRTLLTESHVNMFKRWGGGKTLQLRGVKGIQILPI